jgi:hypothetical protein
MMIRMYKIEGPKGPQGVVLGFLLIGVGAVIVTAGLALLIVVALAGAALGTGVLLYRRLTGKPIPGLPRTGAAERLDPSLEVFAPDPADARAALPPPGERKQP